MYVLTRTVDGKNLTMQKFFNSASEAMHYVDKLFGAWQWKVDDKTSGYNCAEGNAIWNVAPVAVEGSSSPATLGAKLQVFGNLTNDYYNSQGFPDDLDLQRQRATHFFEEVATAFTMTLNDGNPQTVFTLEHSIFKDWYKWNDTYRPDVNHPLKPSFDKFLKWAHENDLDATLKYAHDGIGESSWWNVVITPKVN